MAAKKTDKKVKDSKQKVAARDIHDIGHARSYFVKDFEEADLSYSGTDISNISNLQKLSHSTKTGPITSNQPQISINSSGILSSPYSNILKSNTKNTSNNSILDQLMNSNAALDFNSKPSPIFESNVRGFGHKNVINGHINNRESEEELMEGKPHFSNIFGESIFSSPFYNSNFTHTDHSPVSNGTTNNNAWVHSLDLFKTPLKTPTANIHSHMKSGSSFPMTALKLSINQQSSVNNPMSTNADINNINPLLNENNQSPIVTRKSAKEARKEKKRRLKIEINNHDPAIVREISEQIEKSDEDLSSEATIDMSLNMSYMEEGVAMQKPRDLKSTNKSNDQDTDDEEKETVKLKVSLSPKNKALKKTGNILPKNSFSRVEMSKESLKTLPRMGSFSTQSQSRMSSFNNTTVNTSSAAHYQHHFTNDSNVLGGMSNKRNVSVLSNSSYTTNVSSHSNTNGSIKKIKKKRASNNNFGSGANNDTNSGKKYQIVLKFPDTFS